MQFVAWYCKRSSIVPLLGYVHNPVYQEQPKLNNYFTNADKKIFDLRCRKGYSNEIEKVNRDDRDLSITIILKAAATKKIRFHVTGYYQDEYILATKRRPHDEL